MPLKQWVNLSKNDIFKDSTIGSLDRCGKAALEITVEKADKPLGYTLKIIPVDGNVRYTPEEEKRNPNFQMTKSKIGVIDAKTLRIDDIQLPAAGGNKYRVEVTDANGNVVTDDTEIETWRRLYYQVIAMDDGKTNKVVPYSLARMEVHGKRYFIELKKQGTDAKMPYIKTIKSSGSDDPPRSTDPEINENQFAAAVKKAFTLAPDFRPLGMAAVFSEYIASFDREKVKRVVTIGIPHPHCAWNDTGLTVECDYDLWFGLDDADDAAKKWFIDGYIDYVDPEAPGSGQSYFVSRDSIRIAGPKRYAHGGHRAVEIKIDEPLRRLLGRRRGQITVLLEINIVAGWTNGFSWQPYRDVRLITCARRTMWEDMPAITQEYTWNHEVGHRFGMTAWGHSTHGDKKARNKLPDGPSTLYGENRGVNDNGHQGPHCGNGASYDKNTGWSGTPKCVMFGANGTYTAHAPSDYCELCAPIVRKVDLSAD